MSVHMYMHIMHSIQRQSLIKINQEKCMQEEHDCCRFQMRSKQILVNLPATCTSTYSNTEVDLEILEGGFYW